MKVNNRVPANRWWHGFYPSLLFGLLFYLSITRIIPWVIEMTKWNPYIVSQLVNTLVVFGPIFFFALWLLRNEGIRLEWSMVKERVNLNKPSGRDILVMLTSLLVGFLLSGLLAALIEFVMPFSLADLGFMPDIEMRPLKSLEFLFLIVIPIPFFFNFVGEELLWRGVLFLEQEKMFGKWVVLVNAVYHMVFHLYMGAGVILILPITIAFSYTYYKTKNLYMAIAIHALVGFPMDFLLMVGVLNT